MVESLTSMWEAVGFSREKKTFGILEMANLNE